jgi:hypothetical protein
MGPRRSGGEDPNPRLPVTCTGDAIGALAQSRAVAAD